MVPFIILYNADIIFLHVGVLYIFCSLLKIFSMCGIF